MAAPQGTRGAGLGNEIFALAKAHIGAAALDATLVEQPWWLNRRHYGRDLGYNVVPPVVSSLAGTWLPRFKVLWEQLPYPWDYSRSMQSLKAALPRSHVVVHSSGMAGGYLTIRSARAFLRHRLGLPEHLPCASGPLRVGLHVRAGDFTPERVRPGVFNARLSPGWIVDAVRCIRQSWGGDMALTVVTDAAADDPLITGLKAAIPRGIPYTVSGGGPLDDLRTLAASEVVVPSVSSFSMLALFLSQSGYLWPAHHLNQFEGWLSIWGHEQGVRAGPIAETIQRLGSEPAAAVLPRGVPMGEGHQLDLREWLRSVRRGLPQSDETDLILHGVVKAG